MWRIARGASRSRGDPGDWIGSQKRCSGASHADALEALLAIVGVEDLFGARARPPKPAASKPDPATIDVALGRVDADRSRVVMVGDTPYDVQAGRAARVDVIGFTTGGYSVEALAGAVAVYDGPADVLARWDDSLFGSTTSGTGARASPRAGVRR